MQTGHRRLVHCAAIALLSGCATAPQPSVQTGAQSSAQVTPPSAPAATGLAADLLMDIDRLEPKVMGLAREIPAERYEWRPAPGVRSVSEVLRHVAADNYFLAAAVGHAAPAATGIRLDDFNTAVSFEQRVLGREETIAQLEHSFAHLKQALNRATPDRMSSSVSLFGRSFTVQQTWILATTHLHEHLGQLIAYARSVNVVPPWSR